MVLFVVQKERIANRTYYNYRDKVQCDNNTEYGIDNECDRGYYHSRK